MLYTDYRSPQGLHYIAIRLNCFTESIANEIDNASNALARNLRRARGIPPENQRIHAAMRLPG